MTAAYFEDHPTDPNKVILRKRPCPYCNDGITLTNIQHPQGKPALGDLNPESLKQMEIDLPEPAAWMNKYGACKTSLFRDVEAGAKEEYTIPLYTTPPQRKPLTVEEIEALAKKHIAVGTRSFEEFARRIEAAHGIKGET